MNNESMDVRNKIIDAAHHMFAEKGYPRTTINDIITQAKCSKGGFYHHFANKGELMDAILNSYVSELEVELFKLDTENVFEALGNVIFTINSIKSSKMNEWPKLIKILSFPENEIFIRRMADSFSEMMVRLYTDIFKKGNQEKAFVVEHPDYLASLWTRELLEVYSRANQVVFIGSEESTREFLELVSYSEEILNATLKDSCGEVRFKDEMAEYISKAMKAYREIKNVIDL
ncbi:MAG: TetR/AcrR family transcriptional regulator [Bacillota bacterium]|nr:TetR/AcrR family transcriptional regulator [Bacillota bacterium]